MPQPSVVSQVYATDEDVALRAPGDFAALAPESQKIAQGADGVLDATGWILTSASNAFLSRGAASNQCVILSQPKSAFVGGGEVLALDSAGANTITLRRLGKPLGFGFPPGALLSGVHFKIKSVGPQLELASFEANRFFGLDPNLPGTSPSNLYDPRELRQFVVLTALQMLFASQKRDDKGDWAEKLRQVQADLADLRAMLTIRWGSLGQGEAPRNRFSTQLRR